MSQQMQTRDINTFRTMLEKAGPKLAEVAPKHLKVERLTKLLLSAISRNPKIMQCSPESVLQFAMSCSQAGLEPIGAGGAWAIPYENRKNGTVELQFIPDYRGLINCAKRAECIKDAYAEVVYANDEFDYELGLEPRLTHKPARGDRGALEAAYCIIVFPDDTKRFVVMSRAEIEGIRKRSRAANAGPWVTDEAEMWKKTVVRRAMKQFAGASQSLDAAIQADDAITGVVDVTPRAPVPPPPSLPDPIPAAPAGEDNPPGVDEQPPTEPEQQSTPAPAAPAPAVSEDWQIQNGVRIIGVRVPTKKGQPYRVDTQEHGVFKTWDDKLANDIEAVRLEGATATFWFYEKPAKDPKYPADIIVQKIETER